MATKLVSHTSLTQLKLPRRVFSAVIIDIQVPESPLSLCTTTVIPHPALFVITEWASKSATLSSALPLNHLLILNTDR